MILCSCRYTENKQHQLCVIKVTSTKLSVIISILFRLQYINLKFYNTMEIKEIKISEDCIACGNCESVCPEVFKVNEKSEVNTKADFKKHYNEIRTAARECPVEAIILKL